MTKPIFHIVTPERWDEFATEEFYEAESLKSEGFIHCSFEDQLDGVIGRYYRDAGELVILELDPSRLGSELVEEASTNGELYPHIYGRIHKSAIVSIQNRKQ
jgi:uncharacterized protein (DUF952 family)